MARTKRQKDAEAALEAAIIETAAAWAEGDDDSVGDTVLTDWIVVTAEIKPNMADADEDETVYSILMSNGGLPMYKALGLLHAGLARLKHCDD